MDSSKVLLILLLTLVISFSHFAYRRKHESRIFLLLCISTLTIIVGLRGVNCGLDTANYYYSIENNFPYNWLFEEAGFRLYTHFFYDLFHDAKWVMLLYAAITNTLIIIRLWDFRKNASFTFMVALYSSIYVIQSMNVMRQFVAVALIFYATRFLEDNKFLRYGIFLCVAVSFHQTALLGIGYLCYYYWKYITSNRNRYILILPFLAGAIFSLFISFRYEARHITNYITTAHLDINAIFIYEIACLLILIFCENKGLRIRFSQKPSTGSTEVVHLKDASTVFYLLGLILSIIGMFFAYLNRIGFYYMLFGLIVWGRASKTRSGNFYVLIALVFAFYIFISELIGNGSGIFPYSIQGF